MPSDPRTAVRSLSDGAKCLFLLWFVAGANVVVMLPEPHRHDWHAVAALLLYALGMRSAYNHGRATIQQQYTIHVDPAR